MRVVIDIETNALENPDKIWVIVCKDIDTNEYHIFRNVTDDETVKQDFINFSGRVNLWIGHNILGYDFVHLNRLLGFAVDLSKCLDTLVVSKLANYARDRHSLESYGTEYNLGKLEHADFSHYSSDMETYCIRDVDINHFVYSGLLDYIDDPAHAEAIDLEQWFEYEVIQALQSSGFAFNRDKANRLLERVTKEIAQLDVDILTAFPPRTVVVRTFTPKATKYGTISLTSVPKTHRGDALAGLEIGKVYEITKIVEFNPASHKQIVDVLNEAGWSPTEKTKTHVEFIREAQRTKYLMSKDSTVDSSTQMSDNIIKLEKLEKYGWKINETNLSTLPPSAPKGATLLAQRILLESRRRTLTEWLALVSGDGRIHGKFYGLGAWTHRMAHQRPNTANIPNEFDNLKRVKLLGKEMRQLWMAPKKRLLVGVDADAIQLRIFAHYIDDPEFTASLVNGKKEDKSDPHSLNKRVLGDVCKDRQQAKRFVFALLLGAGLGKLREILECEQDEAERALERLLVRYQGFALLKRDVIPQDAKRGWFTGLDGRTVPIPADTVGGRQHLAMSGYLQNGEAIAMKRATRKWHARLKEFDAKLVDLVHDEWQVECPNDWKIAEALAIMMCDSLKEVGEDLKLRCPLAGSYKNDHDYTIGTNWYQTH